MNKLIIVYVIYIKSERSKYNLKSHKKLINTHK